MAERHVRAVHAHSKSSGRTYDVMKEIALDIGHNDEPMFTSKRKLAERIMGSVNSVANAIKWGIANGELALVQTVGQRKYYALLLPVQPRIETDTVHNNRISQSEATDTVITSGIDTVLSEIKAELIQLRETVSVLNETVSVLCQLDSQTVSVNRINRISPSHTCVEDRSIEEGEEDAHVREETPPPPLATSLQEIQDKPFAENSYLDAYRPSDEFVAKNPIVTNSELEERIEAALGQAVGFSKLATGTAAKKFYNAVSKLTSYSADPAFIHRHFVEKSGYWYSADWRGKQGDMPTAANVLDEYQKAQNWAEPGKQPERNEDDLIARELALLQQRQQSAPVYAQAKP